MSFRACTVSGVYHYLSFFGRVPNLLNNVHLDWWWCPPRHSALQLYGSLPEEFWSLLRRTEVQQEINRAVIWDHVSKTTPFNISLWELCQNPIVFRARKLHISSASILMFSRSETIGFCVARFLFSERFIGTFVLSFFVYLCKKKPDQSYLCNQWSVFLKFEQRFKKTRILHNIWSIYKRCVAYMCSIFPE